MFQKRISFNKELITTKPIQATALGYNPEKDLAPRVLASGRGEIAQKIIALANANQIPVCEDSILTAALAGVDVGDLIPPELYFVVAEVLAYVYRIQQKYGMSNSATNK